MARETLHAGLGLQLADQCDRRRPCGRCDPTGTRKPCAVNAAVTHSELKMVAETGKGALAACVRGRRYLDAGRTRADGQVLHEAPRSDDALLRSHRPSDRTGPAIALDRAGPPPAFAGWSNAPAPEARSSQRRPCGLRISPDRRGFAGIG